MKNINILEFETSPNPQYTIIWIHGLGSNSKDSMSLLHLLNISDLKIRFVCPDAPRIPVTINNKMIMQSWYDIKDKEINDVDLEGLKESKFIIDNLINKEVNRGIKSTNIILGGFSQGGVLSLYVANSLNKKLASIICLSGYLAIDTDITNNNTSIPFFLAHRLFDNIIPIQRFYSYTKLLKKAGYANLFIKEYENEHNVCQEELYDLHAFIRRLMI
ncbi:phospholipase/carboxylesterase [Candidatus Kinetoplastibacterium desouzaii TCC079E]|uniref:Phospholipase/carboxylesterase n=1 Tax=Candidatus Kinetoplastidibacterium desouzai TCC079E TaxID=1208919 RepID=M1LV63_9PROT|nr:phospholipase/carboxylesterase [Candidatus Kinetoplastibacterium desouzaii]AGF47159.1 phospholipase/carboxylesterase [Candidatus Kinetoplastibacterium desouzaii TCC079E]